MTDAERTAIYRFFGTDDELLYIGITKSFGNRWLRHAADKPWWPAVQRHTAEWLDSREAAEAAEKAAILAERPKHNFVHVPKPPRPKPPPPAKPISGEGIHLLDEWTVGQCAEHWGIKPATWRSYVTRGHAPGPAKHVGATPVWDPQAVKDWVRPGRGARTDKADQEATPQE